MFTYCVALLQSRAFALLDSLKSDRKGITALEYATLGAVIVGVVFIAATALGGKLSTQFGLIGTGLSTAPGT